MRWKTLKTHAILDESGNVIPATVLEWAVFFETSTNRFIMYDEFLDGKFTVSTVFLGLNHNYSSHPNAVPFWFETIVFGPEKEQELFGNKVMLRPDLWLKRCSTLEQAKAMHAEGLAWLNTAHLQAQ